MHSKIRSVPALRIPRAPTWFLPTCTPITGVKVVVINTTCLMLISEAEMERIIAARALCYRETLEQLIAGVGTGEAAEAC